MRMGKLRFYVQCSIAAGAVSRGRRWWAQVRAELGHQLHQRDTCTLAFLLNCHLDSFAHFWLGRSPTILLSISGALIRLLRLGWWLSVRSSLGSFLACFSLHFSLDFTFPSSLIMRRFLPFLRTYSAIFLTGASPRIPFRGQNCERKSNAYIQSH